MKPIQVYDGDGHSSHTNAHQRTVAKQEREEASRVIEWSHRIGRQVDTIKQLHTYGEQMWESCRHYRVSGLIHAAVGVGLLIGGAVVAASFSHYGHEEIAKGVLVLAVVGSLLTQIMLLMTMSAVRADHLVVHREMPQVDYDLIKQAESQTPKTMTTMTPPPMAALPPRPTRPNPTTRI